MVWAAACVLVVGRASRSWRRGGWAANRSRRWCLPRSGCPAAGHAVDAEQPGRSSRVPGCSGHGRAAAATQHQGPPGWMPGSPDPKVEGGASYQPVPPSRVFSAKKFLCAAVAALPRHSTVPATGDCPGTGAGLPGSRARCPVDGVSPLSPLAPAAACGGTPDPPRVIRPAGRPPLVAAAQPLRPSLRLW